MYYHIFDQYLSQIARAVSFTVRALGLLLLLILAHITTIYTVEQLELLPMTPMTVSNVRDSHLENILVSYPFLVILRGWAYLLAFAVYHTVLVRARIERDLPKHIGLGVAVAIPFFLLWWVLGEWFDPQAFRQGFIVFPLLGMVLALLHRWFFPRTASGHLDRS